MLTSGWSQASIVGFAVDSGQIGKVITLRATSPRPRLS